MDIKEILVILNIDEPCIYIVGIKVMLLFWQNIEARQKNTKKSDIY